MVAEDGRTSLWYAHASAGCWVNAERVLDLDRHTLFAQRRGYGGSGLGHGQASGETRFNTVAEHPFCSDQKGIRSQPSLCTISLCASDKTLPSQAPIFLAVWRGLSNGISKFPSGSNILCTLGPHPVPVAPNAGFVARLSGWYARDMAEVSSMKLTGSFWVLTAAVASFVPWPHCAHQP